MEKRKYNNFEETPVWQNAHSLVLKIYEISRAFPREELYNLVSQIRRAAVSIETNIAEAFGRFHFLDKTNFYYNARGSTEEVKSLLITAKDLHYISNDGYEKMRFDLENLGQELNLVINSVRKSKERG